MTDLFPYAIYDTKRCAMVFLGLFENEAACWREALDQPTRGEVRAAQEDGLICLPCTVSYKPPEVRRCDASAAKGLAATSTAS